MTVQQDFPCGDLLPSTDSATAVAALFTCVDSTTKSSDFPKAFMPTLPSVRFAGRSGSDPPSGFAPEADGISRPVSWRTQARLECPRMHRFYDSAVPVDALP